MEAALTFPIPQARVEVRGDTVTIDGVAVQDRTLAELVAHRSEQGDDGEDTVRDALEIGARVLDREAKGAEVDFVRREFEKLSSEVERSFADKARAVAEHMQSQFERFLGEDSGTMAKALDSHSEELGELIERHFGGDRSTAVQHQLRELMSRALQERRADLEAERERGTAKGRSFEEACFGLLESMAAARGDAAHHVGDERSASGGKLGDVVIELEAAQGESRGRIAVEVKDEQLSKNKAWEVLNGALRERDAAFAVLVVASDDKVPAGREPLHEYEGNKMIVALDRESLDPRPLELAYRYARCRCLMARERSLQVDAAGVHDATEEALSALKDAQRIRVALTGATTGVGRAREYLDAMVERVESSLERVEGLIATGED